MTAYLNSISRIAADVESREHRLGRAIRRTATIWNGEPNAQLVAEVSALSPDTALDVGCGEGADVVWLTQQGAVDISRVAIDRARQQADALSLDISFVHADLVTTPPQPTSYDLVSAQFFQLEEPARDRFMISLGRAVRPAGQLLVVRHCPTGDVGPSHHPERFFTSDEITACLPPRIGRS